ADVAGVGGGRAIHVESGEVEDLRRAPAGGDAVGLVVGNGLRERIGEAVAGVRRVVDDDVRPRRDAAGLLHVQRRLAAAAVEDAAAVHVHLGDAVRLGGQADVAPVGL